MHYDCAGTCVCMHVRIWQDATFTDEVEWDGVRRSNRGRSKQHFTTAKFMAPTGRGQGPLGLNTGGEYSSRHEWIIWWRRQEEEGGGGSRIEGSPNSDPMHHQSSGRTNALPIPYPCGQITKGSSALSSTAGPVVTWEHYSRLLKYVLTVNFQCILLEGQRLQEKNCTSHNKNSFEPCTEYTT